MQGFWTEFSNVMRSGFEQVDYSAQDMEMALECLSFSKSLEYVDRLDAKRESVCSDIAQAKITNIGNAFLPLPFTIHSTCERDYVDLGVATTKIKTKGTPQGSVEAPTTIGPAIEKPLDIVRLSKKRSLTTFYAMFPSTPWELKVKLDWITFVNSMGDAGFIAMTSGGGGSSVKFRQVDGKGSINFHKPHPEAVLEPHTLHAIGWRMSRRFGWARDLFVFEQK